jgi:opacity protein-like surface antigen
MKKLLITAACLAGLAVPSTAKASNFDGAFLGLSVGYNNTSLTEGINAPGIFSESTTFGATGAEEGVLGGYRMTHDKVMFGVEVEGMLSQAQNTESATAGANQASLKLEKRYGFTVGPRIGYLVTDSTLLFVGADWAHARFRATGEVNGTSASTDDSKDGLRFGGGFEVAADSALNLRLDYQHTDWRSWNWSDGAGDTASLKAHEDTVRISAIHPF